MNAISRSRLQRASSHIALGLLVSFQLLAADLETVSVSYTQIPRIYRLDGVVEAVNKTTVSAQISGQVEAILFDVDDYVDKDEVIILINDKQPAAKLEQTKAEMEEAGARLIEAEEEHQRVKGVFEKDAVSKKAMDSAEAAMKAARARQKSARAGLEQAQEQFDYTRVRAPYSGIVTERHIEVGESAQPGMKLMSGLSLEDLRVSVDVPQNMINSVRNAVEIGIETPGEGRVPVTSMTVFPFADSDSHTFRVRLELKGDGLSLFPGMFVKAAFTTGEQGALIVPGTSIIRRSEVTAVYVMTASGRLSLRAIRKGRELDNGNTVVLAGLQEGETVVVDPVAAGAQLKQQYRSETAN